MSKFIKMLVSSISLMVACTALAQTGIARLISQKDFVELSREMEVLDRSSADRLKELRKESHVRAAKVASLSVAAFDAGQVVFSNSEGIELVLKRSRVERRSDQDFTWFSDIEGGGTAIFSINGQKISGVIRPGGNLIYEISHLKGSMHVVKEVDTSKLNGDPHDSIPPPAFKLSAPPSTQLDRSPKVVALAATSPTVDILVIYTPSAASYLGDVNGRLQITVSEMNQALANSRVTASVRLAGVIQAPTDYSESSIGAGLAKASLDELSGVSQNTQLSYFARTKRDETLADVVILLGRYSTAASGVAYQAPTAEWAFGVVDAAQMDAIRAFAHEAGHIFGAGHNTQNDSPPNIFSYGHGRNYNWQVQFKTAPQFNGIRCWRTIMAYAYSQFSNLICNVDSIINFYSNPAVNYTDTHPFVTPLEPNQSSTAPTGSSFCCDNARVMNENASRVAQFSNIPISVGLVRLDLRSAINILLLD